MHWQVITVNKKLDSAQGFALIDDVAGPNPDSVDGEAVAYIWKFTGPGSS